MIEVLGLEALPCKLRKVHLRFRTVGWCARATRLGLSFYARALNQRAISRCIGVIAILR